MHIIEHSLLITDDSWEKVPIKDNYLDFGLAGALITKSRNESDGNPCIVVKINNHYEVHKIRRKSK